MFISSYQPDYTKNFAIFDFDHTIVRPKNGKPFPTNKNDWEYNRKSVPEKLRDVSKTHQMVIVTDQSKKFKIEMINDVVKDLRINFNILIGLEKEYKKPDNRYFLKCFPEFKPKDDDFFIGDAAGRKEDWSSVDINFAKNIGVKFIPTDLYFEKEEINEIQGTYHKTNQEVVIMVGLPGVGKSYFSNKYLEPFNYEIIESDVYKTPKKMLSIAQIELEKKKSVVFVATNVTIEKRKIYIDFAKIKKLNVRCIWLNSTLPKILDRNKGRPHPVPNVAIYTANKRFEMPNENEGFELIKIDN